MLKIGTAKAVPPFRVMDVITAANALSARLGPTDAPVIRMEVGQPALGVPGHALVVAQRAMGAHALGYTEALGLPDLRARIAAHYADWYNVSVSPNRVAVVAGASAAFPLSFLAAFEPGDRIALATPCYPPYLNIMTALGLRPVALACDASTGFQPTIAMLDALDPPPDGVLIASPANPTGSMLSADDLATMARYCHAKGIRLISDEIYHGLTYGKPVATACAYSPSAIVINSFSKYFSMTGWRVGWMLLPEDLIRPVERLAQNMFICAPHISQVTALAAFDCHPELQARRDRYARSRDILLAALPQAGLGAIAPPDGAFYLYADISASGQDSTDFCRDLLADWHIAATPGHDFDSERGGRFIRLSYCADPADIEIAAQRLIARAAKPRA